MPAVPPILALSGAAKNKNHTPRMLPWHDGTFGQSFCVPGITSLEFIRRMKVGLYAPL
jgi:hypothetical protein